MFQQLLDQAKSAQARYLQNGDPTGLDEAITAWQRILQHPDLATVDTDFRLRVLNDSAITYIRRYGARGELSDLDRALSAWQTIVTTTPPDSPYLPGLLNNLGNGLTDRYARTGDLTDLQAGIENFQQAVSLTPAGSPELPRNLNNLGLGLTDRYSRTGDLTDLQAGIDNFQQAVSLIPAGSPDLPSRLNNLGNGFQYRYARTGDLTDLQAGIEAFQRAVQLTPADSPKWPMFLNNLGNGLRDRGAEGDSEEAIKCYQRAAQRGLEVALEVGLRSARNWLRWAFGREAWEEVGTAYQLAYQASTRLVQVQLQRADQETWLTETQGLAAHAAYAYAKLGHWQDAVVTLEAGLARLFSEALAKDRTDFQQLQEIRPDLYDLYQHTLADWEHALHQIPINLDELRRQHHALAQVIQDLRTVPGYELFLLTPTFEDIKAATTHTTLVYIAVTRAGGLALLVNATGQITPIWLDKLTENQLQVVLTGLKKDTASTTDQPARGYVRACLSKDQNAAAHQRWEQQLANTTDWLWQTVMGQLIDHLQDTTTPITLIPVGRLNVLPLHAAWTEDSEKSTGKRYALDHHLFTYAPNARALTEARKVIQRRQPEQLLAVADPRPVSGNLLPNASHEVQTIAATFAPANQQIYLQKQAICDEVLKLLPTTTILHFACHGTANLINPLQSGVVMAYNECLTLEEILTLRLKNLRLVTLSACETAIPGLDLPEEVVNLPAGLLQAGAAGVVASLWSVNDLSTALLMTRFYDYWRGKEKLELGEALRQAQIWLRDSTEAEKFKYVEEKRGIHQGLGLIAYNGLRQELTADSTERKYAHPYHWAAFGFTGV